MKKISKKGKQIDLKKAYAQKWTKTSFNCSFISSAGDSLCHLKKVKEVITAKS